MTAQLIIETKYTFFSFACQKIISNNNKKNYDNTNQSEKSDVK